ncbi:MAG: hypothetical protein ACKOFH_11175, partial [Chthoniobacterales bacterium]
YNTAALAIRQLQQEGVVVQKGEARRDRVFCAQALLDILEEQPELTARQPASSKQKRASRKSRR